MANNLLPGLLGFAVFAVLVFIAVQMVSNHTHHESSGTVIFPAWRPGWRPWPRPRPGPGPRPRPTPKPTKPLIGGCSGTRYGCCADGRTAKRDAVGSNCLLY